MQQNEKFYDAENRRLVYIRAEATSAYWDDHWSRTEGASAIKSPSRFVLKWTRKYLPAGSKVIDGGCGLASTVFGLQQHGFEAVGVDYASETVKRVNEMAPELNVIHGDVRDLAMFEENSFDGYWSLGVIEHFYDGYAPILTEIQRLLKPGGYAFVTVPAMSPIRRLKAKMGYYELYRGESEGFYQFAFPGKTVESSFANLDFELVALASRGGFKGLKDEVRPLRRSMQWLYDKPALTARYLRSGLGVMLSPFSYHTRLFVFRKAPASRQCEGLNC